MTSTILRRDLAARLEARRAEIEDAVLTRVYSLSGGPSEAGDPQYAEGLRKAVSAALGYAIAGIEAGDPEPGPTPDELFAQARHAARSGVSIETVTRRYFAGHTLLTDFVMQEAEAGGLFGVEEVRSLGKTQAELVDRLIALISAEYQREVERRTQSRDGRRTECVRALLAGELPDTSQLTYDLEAHHLGAIAVGRDPAQALRDFAGALDRRLLLVDGAEGSRWGWLGGSRGLDPEEVEAALRQWPAREASLALGEPARGLPGWRLTHRQAAAALYVGRRRADAVVRYADVALLATVLQDDLLMASLRQLYLNPLAAERDGGETLRQTLRAYFAADRNVSSTASALGVSRKTVTARLRAVEERLGRPLNTCAAELEAALWMEFGEIKAVPHPTSPPTTRNYP